MKNLTKKLSVAFLILAPMTTANAERNWFNRKPKTDTQVVANADIDKRVDTIDAKDLKTRTGLFHFIIKVIDKYKDKATGDQEELRNILATGQCTPGQKSKIDKLIKKLEKKKSGCNSLQWLFNKFKGRFCN